MFDMQRLDIYWHRFIPQSFTHVSLIWEAGFLIQLLRQFVKRALINWETSEGTHGYPEGPARHLDVSRQNLSPPCLEATFDSRLPSPKLSPKMPPKLSLPHKRGLFFLVQNDWVLENLYWKVFWRTISYNFIFFNVIFDPHMSKIEAKHKWSTDFYPVRVLGGIVLALWGCQTPAQYWIKIVHPWVQKFYPVLGLGSGERLLWHCHTPVLHWITFSLRIKWCFR